MSRLIIAGGGLAGGLAALALAQRRPDVDVLLIEQGETFGGNHSWSFFDSDVAAEDRWIVDAIAGCHWPDNDIRFPHRARTIGIGYNTIRSPEFDAALRAALQPERCLFGAAIQTLGPTDVLLESGERLTADAVIDARGFAPAPGLTLGWQKFVGRIYRFEKPHGTIRPVIMDATVPQHDGYRFVYYLPLSETDLLIEDTYYSSGPTLDLVALRGRIDAAAGEVGAGEPAVLDEESGVLPIVIDGELDALWPASDPVARLGVRGGFFHPTTSYSLPDAVANAGWLARQRDLSAGALSRGLRQRAEVAWRQRRFFQLLNKLLFWAAEPDERYRVLEHFYRLPSDVVARFYGARLTMTDKLRILTGTPPVPIGKAIQAMLRRAA